MGKRWKNACFILFLIDFPPIFIDFPCFSNDFDTFLLGPDALGLSREASRWPTAHPAAGAG